MPAEKYKPLETLRMAALTAAGVIMAATPLAIWVAWSQAVLVLVLGIGAVVAVLCCVMCAETSVTNEEQRRDFGSRTMEPLDTEFLAELSDMGPFVYDNRIAGEFSFRRKMARLKKKLPDLAQTTGKVR